MHAGLVRSRDVCCVNVKVQDTLITSVLEENK